MVDFFGLNPANPWNQVNPLSPYNRRKKELEEKSSEDGENRFECKEHSHDFVSPNQTPAKNLTHSKCDRKDR